MRPRALRKFDQISNRLPKENSKNFPPNPQAISLLIKTRCAPVITKAHHRASLTEGEMMREQARRHRGTKARSGVKGKRGQAQGTTISALAPSTPGPHSVP